MNPEISIIIPVWNREDKIINAIQSIERQTYKNIEIIIVDDGSIDNSVEIIENHIKDLTLDIKLYKINHSGVSIARNVGIDNARGKYIFFLDSDDCIINSNVLELLHNKIKHYDVDVVSTRFYFSNLSSKLLGKVNTIYEGRFFIESLDFLNKNYNPSLYFVKRDFLNKNNIQFIENLYMEDMLFLFDLCYHNAKFYITDIISILRTTSDNAITNSKGKYNYHYMPIFKKILEKIKDNKDLSEKYYNSIIKFLNYMRLEIDTSYIEMYDRYFNEFEEWWKNERNFTDTGNR